MANRKSESVEFEPEPEVKPPPLPGGFSLGSWAGLPNYECRKCGAAFLELEKAAERANACGCAKE